MGLHTQSRRGACMPCMEALVLFVARIALQKADSLCHTAGAARAVELSFLRKVTRNQQHLSADVQGLPGNLAGWNFAQTTSDYARTSQRSSETAYPKDRSADFARGMA